jgi:hypothetical protein
MQVNVFRRKDISFFFPKEPLKRQDKEALVICASEVGRHEGLPDAGTKLKVVCPRRTWHSKYLTGHILVAPSTPASHLPSPFSQSPGTNTPLRHWQYKANCNAQGKLARLIFIRRYDLIFNG